MTTHEERFSRSSAPSIVNSIGTCKCSIWDQKKSSKVMVTHQLVDVFHNLCHYHSIFGVSWSQEEKENDEKAYDGVGGVEVDELYQVA